MTLKATVRQLGRTLDAMVQSGLWVGHKCPKGFCAKCGVPQAKQVKP